METKINFEVITLLDYTYPLLLLGMWYQQYKPLKAENISLDYERKELDHLLFSSLFELLSFEHRMREYKQNNPGLSIIILN